MKNSSIVPVTVLWIYIYNKSLDITKLMLCNVEFVNNEARLMMHRHFNSWKDRQHRLLLHWVHLYLKSLVLRKTTMPLCESVTNGTKGKRQCWTRWWWTEQDETGSSANGQTLPKRVQRFQGPPLVSDIWWHKWNYLTFIATQTKQVPWHYGTKQACCKQCAGCTHDITQELTLPWRMFPAHRRSLIWISMYMNPARKFQSRILSLNFPRAAYLSQ